MESQSGYCLPVIYQPFDASDRAHWRDRGAMFDFLFSVEGEGARLLDFGPGDGWPSLIVAPFARQVIGVDGSPRRVAVCTANAARLGVTNASFLHVPPGEPLPFPDGSFDGVMAASSIEQTPDPRAALAELYRLLRPGGRLRVHYENLSAYRGGSERTLDLEVLDDSACRLTFYDRHIEEEYADMFRLDLALPLAQALELFSVDGRTPLLGKATPSLLASLRPKIQEARSCRLVHPSALTFLRWMGELGFASARTTHNGLDFAGRLFDALPPASRPQTMPGVDGLLRPLVKIVVDLEAPPRSERRWDPMITAVK
jgi:ubiquinone/menaquinone biosynthesis C-methylase UbiE